MQSTQRIGCKECGYQNIVWDEAISHESRTVGSYYGVFLRLLSEGWVFTKNCPNCETELSSETTTRIGQEKSYGNVASYEVITENNGIIN